MKKVLFLLMTMVIILFAEQSTTDPTSTTKAPEEPATLTIDTDPSEVMVVVNKKDTLIAPFTKEFAPGTYTLLFKKKGYYGKKLKLNLKAGKEHSQKVELRAPSILDISSTPEGATVVLSGDTLGVTPLVKKAIKPGDYIIKVTIDGFNAYEETLSFASGEVKKHAVSLVAPVIKTVDSVADTTVLNAEMDADSEANEDIKSGISLTTSPDSVITIVNETDTLVTPFIKALPEGEHELVLKKKGFYAKKVKITIPKDSVVSQKVTLRAPSYLEISANVDSCRILLNKKDVGFTPYVSNPLKEGTYEIILLKNGYKTHRQSVTISEGESEKIAINLESKGEIAPVVSKEKKEEEKKERKAVAIVAGTVFGVFLTMITAFELSGVGE